MLRETAASWRRIREKTERFRKTFYDSTLPYWLLDCLTSQAAIIRHIGVVFRIANGDIYGWEGSNGCCQPTCTHVWGYEQTLSRLFPDLEKEMRRIDFHHQQRPDGGVNNRTDVPSPPRPTGEQPFTDGHASCILKAYREALNHPDDSLVESLLAAGQAGGRVPDRPRCRRLRRRARRHPPGRPVEHLRRGPARRDELHERLLSGRAARRVRRGPAAWATSAAATRFHGDLQEGAREPRELCWNGEYFEQKLDRLQKRKGEVGPGCMGDQLIGQWWAHQLGLGYLLPRERVQAALRAVFRYNWKPDLTGWKHSPARLRGRRRQGAHHLHLAPGRAP